MMRIVFPRVRGFRAADSGVAGVEFAIVFPVLLLLCLGGYELTTALALFGKVTTISGAVADIASRELHTSPAELAGVERLAKQFVKPYHLDDMQIVVSGVALDDEGRGTVVWSHATGTSSYVKGQSLPITIDAGESSPKFVVVSELSYTYRPVVEYGLAGPFEMSSVAYRYPRVGGRVECPTC